MFKIKTGDYLQLLNPETMKLLGSTKSKITKDKNDENVFCLEITEIVIINFHVVNNSYHKIQESCIYLFVINRLVNY